MFEARFSFVSNLILLLGTYIYINEIGMVMAIVVVVVSFGAAMTVFVEFLQGRIGPREAVPLFLLDAIVYIWLASIVNLSLGISDTTIDPLDSNIKCNG